MLPIRASRAVHSYSSPPILCDICHSPFVGCYWMTPAFTNAVRKIDSSHHPIENFMEMQPSREDGNYSSASASLMRISSSSVNTASF